MTFSPASPPPIAWRTDAARLAIVGAAALVTRLAVALAIPEAAPIADMQEYWERGVYIAEHGRLYENSWRMPGYPAVLALAFLFGSGPSLTAARIVNVVAGTVTALLTYWLARRRVGPGPSTAAALVVALYPSFLVYTVFVTTETLVAIPLLTALLAASFGTARGYLVAGLAAGLATLVRPAGIAMLPALLVSLAYRSGPDRRSRWTLLGPSLAALGFVVVMTPWWVHSLRLHSRFVALDTTGGINLLIGNNPFATGQLHWKDVGPLHGAYLMNVDTTTPAGSDYASGIATKYIREHPLEVVRLIPSKIGALLAIEGREHSALYSIGYFGPISAAALWCWGVAVVVAFPPLLGAALAGYAVRENTRQTSLEAGALFLGVSVLMHVVSFGDPRFHLPMVPVLAVMATGLVHWRSGFDRRRIGIAVLVGVCLVGPWSRQLVAYWNTLPKLAAPNGWSQPQAYIDLQ